MKYIGLPIRLVLFSAFLITFAATYGWIVPVLWPNSAREVWKDALNGWRWVLAK